MVTRDGVPVEGTGRVRRSKTFWVAALLAAAVVLPVGALVAAAQAAPPTPSATPRSACPALNLSTPICHVFVLFLENQDYNWTLAHGSFERYLAQKYALASHFYSIEHYSFPQYVAATSGAVTNYIAPMSQRNVVDLIRASNVSLTWKAYMEGMPAPCYYSATSQYRVGHNPFIFYNDIANNRTYCRDHDVSFAPWSRAVATGNVPNYGFFAPNVTDSCWKTGVKVCDAWLHNWLTPIVNSSFFRSSVFLITYDEGFGTDTQGANGTTGGGHVYTVAVSPYACPSRVSTYNYTHFDLLTTTEWLLKLGRTGTNDSWQSHPPMRDLFCFPSGWHPGVPAPGASAALQWLMRVVGDTEKFAVGSARGAW